jgi:hypothetical protein
LGQRGPSREQQKQREKYRFANGVHFVLNKVIALEFSTI